ncbi:MAG: hypothetical protein R2883_01520 [Caldisericia bacterium]
MTAGRYRLKVATGAEPTPVESEAFYMSCSSIEENPGLHIIETEDEGKICYNITFTTGYAGLLDNNISGIYIGFPEGFTFNKEKLEDEIYVKTSGANTKVRKFWASDNYGTLYLSSPLDIDNKQTVEIRIPKDAVNPGKEKSFHVFIYTSSEPKKVYTNFVNVDSKPKKPKEVYSDPTPISNLKLTSNKAGDETGISFTLDAREKTVSKNSEFRVDLPDGFYIPEKILKSQFMINGHPVKKLKRNTEASISLWIDTRIIKHPYQLRFIDFDLQKYAKIKNPEESGKYTFKIFIDGASETESESFEIVAD